METYDFYSDRTLGAQPQDHDLMSRETIGGLLALADTRISANWLAEEFPERCPDGRGVVGTNVVAVGDTLQALIPDCCGRYIRMDARNRR